MCLPCSIVVPLTPEAGVALGAPQTGSQSCVCLWERTVVCLSQIWATHVSKAFCVVDKDPWK